MGYLLMALLGLGLAPLCLWVLNKMPDRAFCDYDETPGAECASPRFFPGRHGIPLGLFLALCGALLFGRYGWHPVLVPLLLLTACLGMIALSDLKFAIIPDELLIFGGICGFFVALHNAIGSQLLWGWILPFLGAPLGAGLVLLLNLLGRLLYKRDAVGMGDLKLLAVCGLALGPGGIVIGGLLGVLSAGVVFAILMLTKKMKPDQYYPFGPWLVLGTMLTLCFRSGIYRLVAWYLSLL